MKKLFIPLVLLGYNLNVLSSQSPCKEPGELTRQIMSYSEILVANGQQLKATLNTLTATHAMIKEKATGIPLMASSILDLKKDVVTNIDSISSGIYKFGAWVLGVGDAQSALSKVTSLLQAIQDALGIKDDKSASNDSTTLWGGLNKIEVLLNPSTDTMGVYKALGTASANIEISINDINTLTNLICPLGI